MTVRQTNSLCPSPARRWLVVLCLLLVAIAVTAEALHSHPHNLASDAKHCATCQIAHAPAHVAPLAHLNVMVAGSALHGLPQDSHPQQGPDAFALFCRPPPAIE